MHGDFFLIESDDGAVSRGERLAFGETAGRNEAWLRDTLFRHPEILPVRQIDSSFGPLVPMCRELRTDAGPIDIAYINDHGRLTLVECKLWRNPEARRSVVAQILDYARVICRWSYSDLQRQVSAATGRKGNVPFELAKQRFPSLSEAGFVDSATRAMQGGRFLLLIAGDGIHEDVGALAELINRNAASGFAFGLIEVALYGLEDGRIVVHPRTIARTQVIERTVVIARSGGDAQPVSLDGADEVMAGVGEAGAAERNELGESAKQAEYRRWWAPVLAMRFDDPDQEPPKLYWPNNVRTPLPWPGVWILAYGYGGESGVIGVSLSGKGGAEQAIVSTLDERRRDEILRSLPPGSKFEKRYTGVGYTFGVERQTAEFVNDEARHRWLRDTLNHYVNVFRPLILNLKRQQTAG